MVKKMNVNPETELQEVFNVFDVDQDGQISVEELYDVLTRLGEVISKVRRSDAAGNTILRDCKFKDIILYVNRRNNSGGFDRNSKADASETGRI